MKRAMGSKQKVASAVEQLARQSIRDSLREVLRLLAKATRRKPDNAEQTHQLRTATRRADAALLLFVDWLPRRRGRPMRKQVSEIRKKAGAVRDLDVLIRRLSRQADPLPPNTLNWLQKRSASCRQTSASSLRHFGHSRPMKTLPEQLRALRHRIHWRGEAEPPTLVELGTEALGRLAEKYSLAIQAIGGDVEPSQQLNRCHQVRIVGRCLRYTLELLQGVLSEKLSEPVCERLSQLQDTLGELNDQTMALRCFREWQADCGVEECRTSLGILADRESASIAQRVAAIIAELPQATEQVLNLLREFIRQLPVLKLVGAPS